MKKKETYISVMIHIDNYVDISPGYRLLPPINGKRYVSIDANNIQEATELYNAAIKEINKK